MQHSTYFEVRQSGDPRAGALPRNFNALQLVENLRTYIFGLGRNEEAKLGGPQKGGYGIRLGPVDKE